MDRPVAFQKPSLIILYSIQAYVHVSLVVALESKTIPYSRQLGPMIFIPFPSLPLSPSTSTSNSIFPNLLRLSFFRFLFLFIFLSFQTLEVGSGGGGEGEAQSSSFFLPSPSKGINETLPLLLATAQQLSSFQWIPSLGSYELRLTTRSY